MFMLSQSALKTGAIHKLCIALKVDLRIFTMGLLTFFDNSKNLVSLRMYSPGPNVLPTDH